MRKSMLLFAVFTIVFSVLCGQSKDKVLPIVLTDRVWNQENLASFETEVEVLRQRYHIPGLSAGIVNEKKLFWKKGFGFADIENKIVPDENTVYQIASVSKTFASILLMKQVEAGTVNLDDPIAKYGIDLGARWGADERIKVKHLVTHTAMGNSFNRFKPGYKFRYNGDWYYRLKSVIEQSAGQSYGELLMKTIIRPLGLKNTVPSTDDSLAFQLTGYNKDSFLVKMAKPYDWQKNHFVPVKYKYPFGPAAGIMSTVADLALYSNAVDEKEFLNVQTWEQVFTPFVTPKGKPIQYGLGWYVKYYNGTKVIWHTGWWAGYSALLIKVPSKDITFIVLANSQDLTRPFYHLVHPIQNFAFYHPFRKNLNNTLLASDFAKVFMDHFAGL
jgi:CubicO group peptidase (beta-lactamase class C family)